MLGFAGLARKLFRPSLHKRINRNQFAICRRYEWIDVDGVNIWICFTSRTQAVENCQHTAHVYRRFTAKIFKQFLMLQ